MRRFILCSFQTPITYFRGVSISALRALNCSVSIVTWSSENIRNNLSRKSETFWKATSDQNHHVIMESQEQEYSFLCQESDLIRTAMFDGKLLWNYTRPNLRSTTLTRRISDRVVSFIPGAAWSEWMIVQARKKLIFDFLTSTKQNWIDFFLNVIKTGI